MRPIASSFFALAIAAVLRPESIDAQRRLGHYVRRAFDYRAVEAGVIGGPNRTTLTGVGPTDPSIRGMLGGFVSVRLGEGFRLRPELLVSGKEVGLQPFNQVDCPLSGPCPLPFVERTSLTWIEAPLLLEFRPEGFSRAFAPRFYGGPFLALRVGCSQSVPATTQQIDTRLVRPCGEATATAPQLNNGDGGFVIGGGLYRHGVGLGVRWTRSLAEIAPFQSGSTSRLIGGKQSTLTATIEFASRLW